MASQPTATRDVRPVVAAGLCLIAVILGWPLLRERGAEGPAPPVVDRAAGMHRRAPTSDAPAAAATTARPAARGEPAAGGSVAAGGAAARLEAMKPPVGEAATREGVEMQEPPEKTGIAVFPPPGTDPPKAGLVVPDDYELPPGYVRHYQTTDDGQQLPPILMFHPDFQPVDDRGQPIPLPADRVVPADMAPPGMPRDVLVVPPTYVPFVEDPPQ